MESSRTVCFTSGIEHSRVHWTRDWVGKRARLDQWLRLARSKGPIRVGVSPPFTWRRKKNQLPKRRDFIFLYFIRTMEKVQKTVLKRTPVIYPSWWCTLLIVTADNGRRGSMKVCSNAESARHRQIVSYAYHTMLCSCKNDVFILLYIYGTKSSNEYYPSRMGK
jgi:hypothetical protein